MPQSSPRLIRRFSEIIAPFDLILCDVWGVLHNGVSAFEPAHQALSQARELGKTVILLSNAPRPNARVIPFLDRMGIAGSAYDALVTSGDMTRQILAQYAGKPLYLIGPDRDLPLLSGLDAPLSPLEQADYCLCTGLFNDDSETPADYQLILRQMLERNLFLLCANPDLVVEKGDKLIYCAGAIAERYREMGGEVLLIGKPYRIAYEAALAEAARINGSSTPNSRILAIGDAIRTDIQGAATMDIASLFIANGIHAADLLAGDGALDAVKLNDFIGKQTVKPNFISRHLAW